MTAVYKVRFSNNASTTLAAGIASNSPSLQVLAGSGALFPVLGNNEAFVCTLVKNGSPTIREIVLVAGHTSGSDNFTGLIRNLSGTGALAWNAGDIVELRPTAEAMSYFAQFTDLQSQQTNYAIDTGSANAYSVSLPLPLNGHVVGMPIRWKASHTNTGNCTFHDGIGQAPLLTAQGANMAPSSIVAGGIYVSIWDGTNFQCANLQAMSFFQINGSIQNSQVPLSAVAQWESSIAINFIQMNGQILPAQVPNSLNLPGSPTTTTAALGDSSPKVATTGFVNPGSSIGSTGFRKYPDGLIEQWGQISVTSGLTVPIDVGITFPAFFTHGVIGVWPVSDRRVGVAGQAANGSNFKSQVTQSGATVTIDNNGSGQFVATWRALGW